MAIKKILLQLQLLWDGSERAVPTLAHVGMQVLLAANLESHKQCSMSVTLEWID